MNGKLWSLATLCRNRSLPPERLEALQLRKLRAVVEAARRDVPFYRELYAEAGVEPGMPRTMEDLQRLPLVAKPQTRAAGGQNVVSERLAAQCKLTLRTSGTTGVPLAVPLSPGDARIRSLVDFRGLLSLGFRPWDRLVTVGPGQGRAPAPHERLGLFRALVIRAEVHPEEQVRRLLRLRPDILWCYPAELRVLLEKAGHPLRELKPRFLIVSSGVLEDQVRRMAEREWGCEIFVSYACMETGRIAIECPKHRGLHVNADHVLLEIRNGDRAAKAGETGEVVLTTLNQSAMPFIRYRLGDLTAWTGGACTCGNTFPLIQAPEGRVDEALRFAGGERLSPTRFCFALRASDGIEQFQVIQETLGWIRVLIVPARSWSRAEEDGLRQRLLEGGPPGVRLDFEPVERIDATGRKFRSTVSKLPAE